MLNYKKMKTKIGVLIQIHQTNAYVQLTKFHQISASNAAEDGFAFWFHNQENPFPPKS